MISRKLLVFVTLCVTLTFFQAASFDGIVGMMMDDPGEEMNDNRMVIDREKANKDESMKLLELFMKCLKFLKENYDKNEGERKLHELFKYFLKSIEELKDFHEMLEERLERQRGESDMDKKLKKFFGRQDDFENNSEEKMKKLFFIFMKFRVTLKEMKEKEKEPKEEKHKKQFLIFVKFMKFTKESKAKLEMLGHLSNIIESKFKDKFMTFKECMEEGRCETYDDVGMENYRTVQEGQGKDEDENKFGEHFEMFFSMMKYLKEQEDDRHAGDMGRGDTGNDDVKQQDKKKRFLNLLMKLHKHVSERAKEFWQDKDLNPDIKMKKFVFFAYQFYKHLEDLKVMKEKNAKIMEIFYSFCKFLELYENTARTGMEYVKFQKWQEEQRNKAKVDDMNAFLKKVSIFRRMMTDKKEQEAKEERMKQFFDQRLKEHMEVERKDKEDMMKKFVDERMQEHMKNEKTDKEEMMRKFFEKLKEKNKEKDKENKLDAMLQILKHTDL